MELFLQILGGLFIAFLILIVGGYFFIRWKLRSWLNQLMEAAAGGVPPFRVKLTRRSDLDDPDEWVPKQDLKTFDALTEQFEALGFTRLEDYEIEEISTPIRVMLDADQATIGVIYRHPVIKVWFDVLRRYEQDPNWTFGSTKYHGMDIAPFVHQQFFPDQSVEEIVTRFRDEAPTEGMLTFTKEAFPTYFEKAYAREMDWRIERGGTTEEEIRRIAEMNGDECTDEAVRQILLQWSNAIHQFVSERALKQYRKEADLNSFEWDHLQNYGVVVHQRMMAEQLMQIYDDEYYPDIHSMLDDDDEEDAEMQAQRQKWNQRIAEFKKELAHSSPQQVFRNLIEQGNGTQSPGSKWEFKTSVTQPVSADIWTRMYDGNEDEDDWDD